jgi:hypothetical protein
MIIFVRVNLQTGLIGTDVFAACQLVSCHSGWCR